ncbi:glycoside hydrolase family 65 protein [Gorillibacterium massiliense]|uniref:glycoside hydrolase family 65 protein n=1 Tax=Gorillibacterium massiliense TaxID=1280390 RepID=UPI0004BA5483|nr:glycosyl hydrolase family 65 protein [Gorillibacterium massiliense]
MAKVADKYLKVDPWAVVEEGFDPARNRVSESIFSLGNEYMGVRGYLEEGYSGDKLVGSYFNGLFEEMKIGAHYKGIIQKLRFMANAVDWLYTRITVDGEQLDLAKSKFSGFTRKVDFKTGEYTREFQWHLQNGKTIKVVFRRLVCMTDSNLGAQSVSFESVDYAGTVQIRSGLDFSPIHEDQGKNLWNTLQKGSADGITAISAKTLLMGNRLFSGFTLHSTQTLNVTGVEDEKFSGVDFTLTLEPGSVASFDKTVVNYAEKDLTTEDGELWAKGKELASQYADLRYEDVLAKQTAYWNGIWETSDIAIEGDPENQQGIRFCIFQLYQTYHGDNPGFNIGAKGLTGEAYRGLAFWDTESYCLPFYLFNNPKAAKSLLEFRYRTLAQAMERAKDVDCEGACYPIATIDGTESCDLWQHSNTQLHVGTAVGYGIWHYVKMTGDVEYLHTHGIEMLIETSRFYATRGQWGQQTGQYGYFGVMGPDEFQLMVNNNCYINLMAKKLFDYTLDVLADMKKDNAEAYEAAIAKTGLRGAETEEWKRMADNMRIPYEEETGLYEEHDGFFNMPHLDIHSIPVEQFPLYHHWSYDRIYRYDMIKQPDVLMFMFLYNQDFSLEAKRVNYEYYESRCIHESSLSPSIHSILAAEIGKHDEAYKFFEFATRLDLDNYNRNTREGLHTTSIAAAWMNIVYGFGGMRSDGAELLFNPSIPEAWTSYNFRVLYRDSVLLVQVDKENVQIKVLSGNGVSIRVYDATYDVDGEGVTIALPAHRIGQKEEQPA